MSLITTLNASGEDQKEEMEFKSPIQPKSERGNSISEALNGKTNPFCYLYLLNC
jgi:hypothetical protein